MAKPKKFSDKQFIKIFNQIIDHKMNDNKSIIDDSKQDIRINDLANEFNVNVATLRRWCIEHTHCSPKEYLDLYRVEKAKNLLSQGMRSSDVANQLGYTEQKVFCSVFNRY